MSPKVRSSIVNITAVIGAVVAVAGLTAPIARTVDRRYVHSDTFAIVQQGEAFHDSLAAQRHEQEVRDLRRDVAAIDTGVRCLRGRLPRSVCSK